MSAPDRYHIIEPPEIPRGSNVLGLLAHEPKTNSEEYIRKAALPVEELRECLDDRYGPETAALFKTEYRLLERTLAVLEGNDE